jgi:hypothetical protein
MMEQLESLKVVSVGGLNSNVNHIQLSDNEPGSAVELVNFEASLYGGYRRLSGFQPFDDAAAEVDSAGAEGAILGVFFYGDTIMAARKQKAGNTYDFYFYSGTTWTKMVTAFTKSSVGVNRIRYRELNFNGTPKIVFVDGVNFGMIWDGTTWTQIKSTNTGANYANAGGNQVIDAPKYIDIFKNTLFLAQNNIVVYSAPLKEFDFTAASGGGQLPAGFTITQIKPFRDNLYVFGANNIKNVTVSSTNFVLNDVTTSIGCLAPDSVQEIDGDLIYLSQDGFRAIGGTNFIGDVNLNSLSKKIQQLITSEISINDMTQLTSVLIRAKSQVRFFFSSPSKETSATFGVIGCLRGNYDGSSQWEWSRMKGIRASCTASKYIGATEYILHGDYNGKIYRQESGPDFDGQPVQAIYSTPFLDFGAAGVRKTMKKIKLFVRPEGNLNLNAQIVYDWQDADKLNPNTYTIESTTSASLYGSAVYGTATYSTPATPVLSTTVEGSCFSMQVKYTTFDINAPYTIQGALYDYTVEGKK